jgi:hypothetical protein
MGVISGYKMAVGNANTVRRFRIFYQGTIPPYVASNTKNATGRVKGNKDWRGFFLGYGHTPPVFPGEEFTFTGSIDGSKGVTGTAICDRIQVDCPTEQGTPLEYAVFFSSNGELTLGGAVATDSTTPAPPSSVGLGASFGGALADVRAWRLLVEAKNKPYASSSTDGWVKRVKGPIDATAQVTLYSDAPASLPKPNDDVIVNLYVSTTESWELKWCKVEGPQEYGADHESPEPVGGLVVAKFNGFQNGTGSISAPSGVKWPAA